MSNKPTKILLQRADKLGDAIFSLPVVESLIKQYPNTEIHFLTSNIGKKILQTHPKISKIRVMDPVPSLFSKQFKSLVSEIKKEKYDIYIALWEHPALAYLGWLAKIPFRIGDASKVLTQWLYTHPVYQRTEDYTRHQIEFNLDLLKPLDITNGAMIRKLYIPEKSNKNKPKSNKCRVVIFCGTGGTNFPIPIQTLDEFFNEVHQRDEFEFQLCGQDDTPEIQALSEKYNVINNVGKTSFEELLQAINDCHIYIGPDTGPTHIASYLNKPLVFFSMLKVNCPNRWGPFSSKQVIVRKTSDCNRFCKSDSYCLNNCLRQVTGNDVYHAFKTLFNIPEGPVSDQVLKDRHLQASLRIIYIIRSKKQYKKAINYINLINQERTIIFPFYLKNLSFSGIKKLIQFTLNKQANVIQGQVPVWLAGTIRLYFGVVKAHLKPIFVPVQIHKGINWPDYIDLYKRQWQEKK